ncbi:MAG TPA: hypothetical protein VHS58_10980 [Acetobacteraceae bacterium]|nr:hypothetical protein [Acetobacteraceae bacterium]
MRTSSLRITSAPGAVCVSSVNSVTADAARSLPDGQTVCVNCVSSVTADTAELSAACEARASALGVFDDPDVIEDRLAIASEPPLPAVGTPERTRLDAHHAATVAGLLAGCNHHRRIKP